jgi:hypothetical protein
MKKRVFVYVCRILSAPESFGLLITPAQGDMAHVCFHKTAIYNTFLGDFNLGEMGTGLAF